jgi:hypothetical protein
MMIADYKEKPFAAASSSPLLRNMFMPKAECTVFPPNIVAATPVDAHITIEIF